MSNLERDKFNKKYPSGRKWFSVKKKYDEAVRKKRPQATIQSLKNKLEKYT